MDLRIIIKLKFRVMRESLGLVDLPVRVHVTTKQMLLVE